MIRVLETRSQPSVQLQPNSGEHSTAHNAFQQLLQFAPLLDDVDLKCRLSFFLLVVMLVDRGDMEIR